MKKYVYLISYLFDRGVGDAYFTTDSEIDHEDKITSIRKHIMDDKNLSGITIINYQLIRTYDDETPDLKGWIPVTERLPEPEQDVLILATVKLTDNKTRQVTAMAFYENGKIREEDSAYVWHDIEQYDVNDDLEGNYYIPEGWWESVTYSENFEAVDDFVTHWMPLPEKPESEVEKC